MVQISKVLDLTFPGDRIIAAGYIIKLQKFVEVCLDHTSTVHTPRTINEMSLSLDLYHLKDLQKEFFMSMSSLQQSLNHLFAAMDILFSCQSSREFVLFPICIREDRSSSQFVFPKLSDYNIGLPSTQELRLSFLSMIKKALESFHGCGIVYLDFYPSNIMWKVNPNDSSSVVIKVIDWDSVQFRSDRLNDTMRARMTFIREELAKDFAQQHKREFQMDDYDNSLVQVLEYYSDDKRLQTGDKAALDSHFRALQTQYLREKLQMQQASEVLETSDR